MSGSRLIGLALPLCLMLRASAWGQIPPPPRMPGQFRPIVGAGALYQIVTAKGSPVTEWAFAVVGKEIIAEKEAYWLEMRAESGEEKGLVLKQLLLLDPSGAKPKRLIMQAPGEPPVAVPVRAILPTGQGALREPKADAHGLGERVGREEITVPAGTFTCDHYRSQLEGGTTDLWISPKVTPYGVVKMIAGETTMALARLLEKQTTLITGEPEELGGEPEVGGDETEAEEE